MPIPLNPDVGVTYTHLTIEERQRCGRVFSSGNIWHNQITFSTSGCVRRYLAATGPKVSKRHYEITPLPLPG